MYVSSITLDVVQKYESPHERIATFEHRSIMPVSRVCNEIAKAANNYALYLVSLFYIRIHIQIRTANPYQYRPVTVVSSTTVVLHACNLRCDFS